MYSYKILVIDDEPDIGELFSKILSEEGYRVWISQDGSDGITKIKEEKPDLVFLDLKLPGKDGIEVLREIRRFDKDLLVIVLTAYETVNTAVEAMKLGTFDYLSKPVDIEKLNNIIKNALRTRDVSRKVYKLERKRDEEIVGDSPQMHKLFQLVEKVSIYDITVFLHGDSGTGKELIARSIHRKSNRASKPFVVIDCAILPDTLVESEIFGHEKGAFTGAHERKIGKFEKAQSGTVFLDEIGNLSASIQIKLLRAIQEREIERLGGMKPIPVDFRLIAATNINLEKAIKTGRFREDLYYRIKVFSILLPPLRERDDDVERLANHFARKFNALVKKDVQRISPKAMKLLNQYSWPGNVRELKNVIESAVLMADDEILPLHLPLKIQDVDEESTAFPGSLKRVSKLARQKAEKGLITKVLRDVNWNKSKASKILDVDYKTLFNKIKEYNISRN